FKSLNIKSDNKATTKLVELPSSLSKNGVKAIANWRPKPSKLWEFSTISYRKPLDLKYVVIESLIFSLIIFLIMYLGYNFRSYIRWLSFIYNYWNYDERGRRFDDRKYEIFEREFYGFVRNSEYFLSEIVRSPEDFVRFFEIYIEFYKRFQNYKRFENLIKTFLLLFIMVISFVLLFPSNALGATENLSFGNLHLNIEADSSDPNETKAILEFAPLSANINAQEKSQFDLKLGNKKSTIRKITTTPKKLIDQNIIEIDFGKKITKIKTPTTLLPSLKLLELLNKKSLQVTGLIFPESYYDVLEDAQDIVLEYEISNISEVKYKNSLGWLHLYPLDKTLIQISFKPEQMVILSDIEIKKPLNFDSEMNLSGIDVYLTKDGDSYHLKKRQEHTVIIPADNIISIKGELKRYWTEKGLLTIGQIIIAIIVGVISGVLAISSSGTTVNLVFKEFVPLGGGLAVIYALYDNVLSKHPELPSIISGGIPTVFELFTIGSVLFVFPIAAFLAFKKEWLDLIVMSVVILTIAIAVLFFLL
ncbi:MAG: hypothetical protein AAGA80_20510, partial [Cyanobacteria bacterium P01_F01_bin.143]